MLRALALCRICWRQLCRLPNDENFLRVDTRLSARKRVARENRFPFGGRPDEGCWKKDPSTVKAFPIHKPRYDRSPGPRYGACVGFCSVTCEAVLIPSFEVNQSSP